MEKVAYTEGGILKRKKKGGAIMATVFDVAKYILHKMGRISTWKLQKLCYYSQAWQLAWTGRSIFEENFEAWANGPVCPVLFYEHRGMFAVGESDISRGDANNLSDDEKESIDIILKDYGELEPYTLRELSHKESPWKDARGNLPEGAKCQTVITKASMGEYYGSL